MKGISQIKWYFDIINYLLCARHQGHVRRAPTSWGFAKVSSLRYMHCLDRVPKGGGHEPSLEGWEGLFVTFPERAGFTYATD